MHNTDLRVLYISQACSKECYTMLTKVCDVIPPVTALKFNRLFAEGLAHNHVHVECVSSLPFINKKNRSGLVDRETKDNVQYTYIFSYFRLTRYLKLFIYSFYYTVLHCKKNKNTIVIADIYSVAIALGAICAIIFTGVKSYAMVTDIPCFIPDKTIPTTLVRRILQNSLKTIQNWLIRRFGGYIFLTHAMNEVINKKNKPYVIIEGFSDIAMTKLVPSLEEKFKEEVIVYAGSLDRRFGIVTLVQAFLKYSNPHARLWLFGIGNAATDIKEIAKGDERIVVGGMMPNDEIITIEMKASLLINPRPSDLEMNKYSFPSKTIEYMASGTPVLTTRLSGIPTEYNEMLYFFDDESIDGMCNTIEKVLSLSKEELFLKGQQAKTFVMKDKNNLAQAKRFLDHVAGAV